MTVMGLMTDAVTRQALHHVVPLARWEPYAAAVGVALTAQSALARPREVSEWFVRRLTGATSTAQDRAERERSARRVLAPGDPARQRSTAFWHAGGSGPPVLLLNGWSASGLMWPSAFVGRLEARYRVVRVDNRGSGYSRSRADAGLDRHDGRRRRQRAAGGDRGAGAWWPDSRWAG